MKELDEIAAIEAWAARKNRWFFGLLCRHEWKTIKEWTHRRLNHTTMEWVQDGGSLTLQCRHCGNIKNVRI